MALGDNGYAGYAASCAHDEFLNHSMVRMQKVTEMTSQHVYCFRIFVSICDLLESFHAMVVFVHGSEIETLQLLSVQSTFSAGKSGLFSCQRDITFVAYLFSY